MRLSHLILCSSIFFANIVCTFAQQNHIDSLTAQLNVLEKKNESYSVDTSKVTLLNTIAWEMANFNISLDKALDYAGQAIALADKIQWNAGRAEAHSTIARVYRFQRNYLEAVKQYQEASTISNEMNIGNWTATCLYDIAQVYYDEANYPAALDYLLQALRINEEKTNKVDIARDLADIGTIYQDIGDNENALNYYLRALTTNKEINDKYWTAINLQSVAAIYKDENNYRKALDYYSRVLNLEGGNSYSTYMTFKEIGDVYKNKVLGGDNGDSAWEKAMSYYGKAIKTATEVEDSLTVGSALTGMGSLFIKRDKLKEAASALRSALDMLKDYNAPDAIKDCYFNLSKLDSINGDWKNSLLHFHQYAIINDSIFNKKKGQQIAKLQVKYETDKKQGEIEILNKDNELKNLRIEQQSKNILLIIAGGLLLMLAVGGFAYYRSRRIRRESLKQISEAKLASLKSLMDKHFIFSSLHSIDTFLMNNEAEAASDYLVKYAKLIRMILEMSNQAEVSLEEEITLCRSYLDLEKIRYNHFFDYKFSIDPDLPLQQTQFPSMLLQPLVENAVKHGVGSLIQDHAAVKGFISINIEKENDRLVCTVTDNGKGLQFSGDTPKNHRSYSGKGIIERVRVYNNLSKSKASFVLKDNNPGVAAVLILPYIFKKQAIAV